MKAMKGAESVDAPQPQGFRLIGEH